MKLRYSIMLSVLLIGIMGCKDAGTEAPYFVKRIAEDHSGIADPHARWQAYNLTNYVFDQQNVCFCAYGGEMCKVFVRNNEVVDVIIQSNGKSIFAASPHRYKTVDQLFALVASINPDSVASLAVQYDERFGFPKLIYVDYSAQIADEEFGYQSGNIERLLK